MSPSKPAPTVQGRQWTWRFRDTLKDLAVEEPVDVWVHRPVAFALIRPLEHFGGFVEPRHITYVSGLLGVAAGAAFLQAPVHGAPWLVVGALLTFAAVVLDCADGQLARLRGGGSRGGMLLDVFADHVGGISIWFGVCYAITHGWDAWWVWPANLLVLLSVMVHVALYDQFKNAFVEKVAGDPHAAGDARRRGPPGRFERWMGRYYDNAYPGLFQLVGGTGEGAAGVDPVTFRRAFSGPMRWMSFLGLGTHLFAIHIVVLAALLVPAHAFAVAQAVFVGVLNLVMVFAVRAWRRADRALATV